MDSTYPATRADLPPGLVIPSRLREHDALAILAALARRFAWTGALWNRDTVNDALDDLDRRGKPPPRTTTARHITDENLVTDAMPQAALVCAECLAPLHDPPSVTGRLCDQHRTGPDGQPAVVNPATEGLYWLDGDTQIYAPIDWERKSHCTYAGEP